MIGKLYIDGSDAFLEYGIFVERYGYQLLLKAPTFKNTDTTEWPEYDGVEVDLINPILDGRTLSIPFCITRRDSVFELYDALSDGIYHDFYFPEIDKSYMLRLIGSSQLSFNVNLGNITLNFADDFPEISEVLPFTESVIKQDEFEIDNINLSKYGISTLKGTNDNINKIADVRENLKINTNAFEGVEYDFGHEEETLQVRYRPKDATLKLFIKAASITDFWKRYNSFFWTLTRPGLRQLYQTNTNTEYECYYNNNSIVRFDILKGKVWCEFNVTLTFTDFYPRIDLPFLATEDGSLVTTEDGIYNIPIRVR